MYRVGGTLLNQEKAFYREVSGCVKVNGGTSTNLKIYGV